MKENRPKKFMKSFPVGKLPHDMLERMLSNYVSDDPRVVVGPRVGEDATVIDMGESLLVAKSDPITFAAEQIGWYAVNVNANDIASMGATPRWFLATILLPEGKANEELVESIFRDLADSCAALGITLCGGHTEITHGIDRPILAGQMLGEVERERLVTSSGAEPGDALLLTKGIAVEGTAILALEKAEEIRERVPEETIQRASQFLKAPGISVVPDAQALCETCRPKAMHDPTEGGLATALREIAIASEVGLLIEEDQVPVFPETVQLCDCFGIDPWGLIASGALLAAVGNDDTVRAIEALGARGIQCRRIGEVMDRDFGLKLSSNGSERDLPKFETDELGKVFS